nr:LWR-salt protein [Halomicroarcula sp. GDY20]
MQPAAPADAPAHYVFGVTFRLAPERGVTVDPDRFETTLYRAADPPGEDGWLFFRDNLWRGKLADEAEFRRLAGDALGVPVESASFSELRTTPGHLDDLKAAIADDLGAFNADDVTEVLSKYLGSSIRVVDAE